MKLISKNANDFWLTKEYLETVYLEAVKLFEGCLPFLISCLDESHQMGKVAKTKTVHHFSGDTQESQGITLSKKTGNQQLYCDYKIPSEAIAFIAFRLCSNV